LLSYTQAFPGDSIPAVTHRILSDEPLPLVEVCPEAGQAAAAVVHRALKKSVNERFADAEMMATALREVRREFEGSLASEPTLAPGLVELVDGAEAKTPGSGAKPTPVTGQRSREEVAKRRTAQIEAAVSKGRMLMESGQLDDALESCLLALALDEEHPEAQALDQLIRRRQAESHADEMVRDARIELDRGALTAADGLLQQARALVPDGPEVRKLERDLRLARVEQERVRQRAQLLQKIVEDADRALAQGQLEVAVVLAGEGLALDPQSDRARLIKEEAARRLIDDSAALSTATVVRPAVMNPTVIRPAADETTRVRPMAAEPTVIRPVVSAAPTKQVEAVRPPSPAVAPAHLAQQRSSAVSSRVTTAWATVGGLISARSGAMGTHLRGLSPHQKRMLLWGAGGAAAVIALGVVAVLWSNSAPAPVARQQVVIEAVPWATVAGIQAEDGTPVTVPPDASTPFVIDLPPGRYTVRLVGPSPDSAVKVLTVQAEAGGSPPVVTESFVQMTPEDYFEQYLSPLPSQATDASAPAPAEPRP
jgi:tetratricopeptide (TPR) repeat protein